MQNAQSGGSFFCGKPRSGDRMPVLRSFYTKKPLRPAATKDEREVQHVLAFLKKAAMQMHSGSNRVIFSRLLSAHPEASLSG